MTDAPDPMAQARAALAQMKANQGNAATAPATTAPATTAPPVTDPADPMAQARAARDQMKPNQGSTTTQTTPPEPVGWGEDMLRSSGSGLSHGVTGLLGLPTQLYNLASKGEQKFIGRNDLGEAPDVAGYLNKGASYLSSGATDYEPQTTAGKYTKSISEFVPAAVGAGLSGGTSLAGLAARVGLEAVLPGAASEAAGELTEGTAAEPYARIGAALLSPAAAGKLTTSLSGLGNEAKNYKAMTDVLEQNGIKLTAGMKTNNERLMAAEGATTAGKSVADTQAQQFSRAAMEHAGGKGLSADEYGIQTLKSHLGDQFDALHGKMQPVQADAAAGNAVLDAWRHSDKTGASIAVAKAFTDFKNLVRWSEHSGVPIDPTELLAYRQNFSSMTPVSNNASYAEVHLSNTAKDFLSITDDLIGKGLSSADVAAYGQLRKNYRNYLAVLEAMGKPGYDAIKGVLSPKDLAAAVFRQGKTSYTSGTAGPLADLAKAGKNILKRFPTKDPTAAQKLFGHTVKGAIGYGVGSMFGHPALGAILSQVAPDAYSAVKGAALMHPISQAYMASPYMPPLSTAMSVAGQNPTHYQRGGAVMAKADRLVAAAERAKNSLGRTTKPLLQMPDDHVAQALAVANRSI